MHIFTTPTGDLIGKFTDYTNGVLYCMANGFDNYCVSYTEKRTHYGDRL